MKQVFYGIFYLSVFGLLVWGFYRASVRLSPTCFDDAQNDSETGIDCGGPCVSCEIKKIKPLIISPVAIFGTDRIYSVSAEIRNGNFNFGAENFLYEVNFYDASGKILKIIKNKSFIYSGETKNIIEAGVKITEGIPVRSEIKIEAGAIQWNKSQNFFQPKIVLGKMNFLNEGTQVSVAGNITNPNNFVVSKIIIDAFLVDKSGVKIGASKTEIQNVDPFMVENFKIYFPVKKFLAGSVDPEATIASLSVEVLK